MLQDVLKLEKIKVLEKKVSYGRGRGGQSKSCIKIRKNVQDNDLEKTLKSKEEETPKLVFFTDAETIELIHLVGDGEVVVVENKSIEYSLVLLTAAYYVYDLAFPRENEQFLEFIKHCIFEDEDKKKKKTNGFIEMLHKFEK